MSDNQFLPVRRKDKAWATHAFGTVARGSTTELEDRDRVVDALFDLRLVLEAGLDLVDEVMRSGE